MPQRLGDDVRTQGHAHGELGLAGDLHGGDHVAQGEVDPSRGFIVDERGPWMGGRRQILQPPVVEVLALGVLNIAELLSPASSLIVSSSVSARVAT